MSVSGVGSCSSSSTATQILRLQELKAMRSALQAGPVAWIEVSYPSGDVALGRMEMHWSVWFIGLSLVAAVLLRK